MKYDIKLESSIRDQMKIAIQVALQEVLQTPIHLRILSSSISHEELIPEGDLFDMKFRVDVRPKKEETQK